VNYKTAEGLSMRTIEGYQRVLEQWIKHEGDIPIGRVRPGDISRYLLYLRTEYIPQRLSGEKRPISPKTLRNVYVVLQSFFVWASRELGVENPMDEIPVPRFQRAPVEPYSQEEVERMLKACLYAREAAPSNRHRFVMRRHTANRDEAIILTLVDSGLRATELCKLKIGDFDPKRGRLEVKHGIEGGAKGGKGRTVYLGKIARSAVWRYLAGREDWEDPESPLFRGLPWPAVLPRHLTGSDQAHCRSGRRDECLSP
jgi:integrase/recombinase XerD